MKTYFEEPTLTLIRFEAKDVLTVSGDPDLDEDEVEIRPNFENP